MTFSRINVISAWLALALVGQNLAMALYWRAIQHAGLGWAEYERASSAVRLWWPLSVSTTLIALAGLWVLARTLTPSLMAPLGARSSTV